MMLDGACVIILGTIHLGQKLWARERPGECRGFPAVYHFLAKKFRFVL